MFILLPYQHDRMSVKRLPWVSIAILALNLLAFVLTRSAATEARERAENALDAVYAYWAANPFVKTTAAFDERYPKPISNLRKLAGSTLEPPESDVLAGQQREFERLMTETIAAADSGPYARWGFVPSHPTIASLFTSQFLHVGWLHLLGNILFLYLSAPFIENIWGRAVFPLFYLAGGAAAAWTQALRFPESTVPLVGASGAIAAVMGAFLVCHWSTRIRFFWAWMIISVRWGTFPAPAWLMLPIWLASQFVSASAAGAGPGVAYWAHIGGFVFGAAAAATIKFSGLEARYLRPAIAEAVSVYGDARIDRGFELLEAQRAPEAMAEFTAVLKTHPASAEAHDGAFQSALLTNDTAGAARHATAMLEGYLKQQDKTALALQRYEEVSQALPDQILPARLLYAVAAHQERTKNTDAALETCRRLAGQHPEDLFALKGLLLGAKVAAANGRRETTRELLAAARTHKLATGEWTEQIERLSAKGG
jgi:membrane associated rhomboid family serine protease